MTRPTIRLADRQRHDPVPLAWLSRLARGALRRLGVRARGTFSVVFVDAVQMRRLNARFTGHRGLTDVLSFRYPEELVVGEIIIAPAAARRYAKAHGVPYREELARYVVHGLLHWVGHDDQTVTQQLKMRKLEDTLLRKCGIRSSECGVKE